MKKRGEYHRGWVTGFKGKENELDSRRATLKYTPPTRWQCSPRFEVSLAELPN